MSTYSDAYLIYGIEFKNHILNQIMNDVENSFFSKTHLKYLTPSEYVCKQYTPIFGFKIAKHDECNSPLKIIIPTDLPRHFKETFQILLEKLLVMEAAYDKKEYEFSIEELAVLRNKLTAMRDTIEPAFFLAINKL